MKQMTLTPKKDSYKIFNQIASTYDFLNHLLSFGQDYFWRKRMMWELPPGKNLEILDVATGTGDLALELQSLAKVKTVTGLDLSQNMLEIAKEKAFKKGVPIEFIHGSALELPFGEESFDATTVSFGIRNYPSTPKGLSEMYRVLRPNGKALILEFSLPTNDLFRTLYFLHLRYILPFIGKFITKSSAYHYLNATIEEYPYGDAFCLLMKNSGFKKVTCTQYAGGIVSLYTGIK